MSELARATTAQTKGAGLVVVPVGSIEQHGPHLPLDTDTVIAVAVAERVIARLPGAWLAPAITYGASGEHQSFSGTSSIGTEALRTVLVELVRSLRTWAARVVLINAHGGNALALTLAVEQLVAEGHHVSWVPCATEERVGDLHAGWTETSLMLYLRSDTVRLERAELGTIKALGELLPDLLSGGVAAVSANGVLGDPRGATAEAGEFLLEAIAASVLNRLLEQSL